LRIASALAPGLRTLDLLRPKKARVRSLRADLDLDLLETTGAMARIGGLVSVQGNSGVNSAAGEVNADEWTPLPYLIVGSIRSVARKVEILARHFKTLLASVRRKCRRSFH
jgi:hypothetical protein